MKAYVKIRHFLFYLANSLLSRGCGTVVARPLCMRKVRGSTPRISKQSSNGHVFDSRWVLFWHL
eukprot:scaffold9948_cov129-Skeletonema_dohrnii-CCMP3373.AAC.8